MKKYKFIVFLIIIFVGSFGKTYSQTTFRVIVNEINPVSSLTTKAASALFLKKISKWENGTAVMPVDASPNSAIRETFSKIIHGKGTSAIRSFWQQAAFSGTSSAPPEKATDAEIVDFVKKNPGAIGYVSSTSSITGVKVVNIN